MAYPLGISQQQDFNITVSPSLSASPDGVVYTAIADAFSDTKLRVTKNEEGFLWFLTIPTSAAKSVPQNSTNVGIQFTLPELTGFETINLRSSTVHTAVDVGGTVYSFKGSASYNTTSRLFRIDLSSYLKDTATAWVAIDLYGGGAANTSIESIMFIGHY